MNKNSFKIIGATASYEKARNLLDQAGRVVLNRFGECEDGEEIYLTKSGPNPLIKKCVLKMDLSYKYEDEDELNAFSC